jgi:hypothetical protein
MASRYREEDLGKVRPASIRGRESKVHLGDFADPEAGSAAGGGTGKIVDRFPRALKGGELRRLADALRLARSERKEIVWLVGAHVIKCGLSLYLNSLVRRGFATAVATTGSAAIHDLEIAFFGETSEDVGVELPLGRFGMAAETAAHFAGACDHAGRGGLGLGEGVGEYIQTSKAPHESYSVFATALSARVPATVHVALGTDIVHQHPGFPAALAGELSIKDFRIFTGAVGRMFDGGVVIVFGSAVVLPEVFLKAVSVGYNLGRVPRGVTAASFDMLPQYRVRENVLSRPFKGAGESYSFTGHHEIMLPLLYAVLTEE